MGSQICKEGPCCSQGTDADTETKIHHVAPSFAFQEDDGSFYGDLGSDRSPANFNLDEACFLFHLFCASWAWRLCLHSLDHLKTFHPHIRTCFTCFRINPGNIIKATREQCETGPTCNGVFSCTPRAPADWNRAVNWWLTLLSCALHPGCFWQGVRCACNYVTQ